MVAESRRATVLRVLLLCVAVTVIVRLHMHTEAMLRSQPQGEACPPSFTDALRRRAEAAEAASAQLRRDLAAAAARGQGGDAAAVPGKAELEASEKRAASLEAELAAARAELKQAKERAERCESAASAAVGGGGQDGTRRAFYERVYPMAEGEPIPFVGSLLAYEGWKAGNVRQAVLLGGDKAVADGNASGCRHIDVLFQRPNEGRCALVVDQASTWHNNEEGRKGEGWHGEGFAMATALSFTMNTATMQPLKERVPREKWLDWIQRNRDNLLLPFLTRKQDVVRAAKELIGTGTKAKGDPAEPLLVMCANHGHFALLLNFFCSLRAAGIPTPKHFIVTTSHGTAKVLSGMGLTAFYHEGLGEFPTAASEGYGDETFVRMMMLKQFAVYIALLCKYDVLFQDVDLTWTRDPVPALRAESEFYHGQFMDDGARNFLNAPYMANSGFFYLRSDFLSFKFWDQVTMMMLVGPNQRIVARALEVFTARYGLRVRTLPWQRYTNGKHLLIKRKRAEVEAFLSRADVLHFCWTLNIEDKYRKMVTHDAAHIGRDCYFNFSMCNVSESTGPNWRDRVCL